MPTSELTPPRRTQVDRRKAAEQALLDAAVRLFATTGIERTSLAQVGEEAGYSRGLVNHHFGSKAALVERLAERIQLGFVESLGAAAAGQGVEALVAVADSYLKRIADDADQARAFFVMWGAALPEEAALRPIFIEDDARFRAGVEDLVRRGQRARAINSTVDPAGFATAFVGLLRGVAAQFMIDPDGVDLAAAAVTCRHFVHASLTSPKKLGR